MYKTCCLGDKNMSFIVFFCSGDESHSTIDVTIRTDAANDAGGAQPAGSGDANDKIVSATGNGEHENLMSSMSADDVNDHCGSSLNGINNVDSLDDSELSKLKAEAPC